jgi:TolB-like protein/cytochrome c-type biogenesis protein CcmH/NrfG
VISPKGFSVFLSYASEDRADASLIADTFQLEGIDVWFDRNELRGGDAWDATIRERINNCTFFVAIVSRATQARAEGYFRREWKFAIERSEGMSEDRPFLIPVNLDGIAEAGARVPARFRELHWITLHRGDSGAALVKRLTELHERISRSPFLLDPPAATGPSRLPIRPIFPRWKLAAIISGLLVPTACAIWWMAGEKTRAGRTASEAKSSAETAAERSTVAVLPFVSLSDDQSNDYFSDGLTEELSAALTRGSALRVVARTSAYAVRGHNLTVQQIGAQLHAGTLVEGSVRRFEKELKVIVHLVNVANGVRIWTNEYQRPLKDIFLVHTELARDILDKLLPSSVLKPPPVQPTTRNLDAYDAYMRGRSLQLKPSLPENLNRAAEFFKQATNLDPSYALAYARYGEVLTRNVKWGYHDTPQTREAARDAIDRALRLNPELPEAHHVLADFYTIDWTNLELASEELQLAARAQPIEAELLLSLGVNRLNRGEKKAAVDYLRRAAKLDPQNADTALSHALALDIASQYPESIAENERAFQLGGWVTPIIDKAASYRNWKGDLGLALKTLQLAEPKHGIEDDSSIFYWRIRAVFEQAHGDLKGAEASLSHISRELLPATFYYHSKSFLAARLMEAQGNQTGARSAYNRALVDAEAYRTSQPNRIRAHTTLALIYAGLGRAEEAKASAQRCLELIPPDDNRYVASRTGLRVMAQVEARAGRTDAALEIVKSQILAGFWKRYDLLLDVDWTELRRDPRFIEIAKKAPL